MNINFTKNLKEHFLRYQKEFELPVINKITGNIHLVKIENPFILYSL